MRKILLTTFVWVCLAPVFYLAYLLSCMEPQKPHIVQSQYKLAWTICQYHQARKKLGVSDKQIRHELEFLVNGNAKSK